MLEGLDEVDGGKNLFFWDFFLNNRRRYFCALALHQTKWLEPLPIVFHYGDTP